MYKEKPIVYDNVHTPEEFRKMSLERKVRDVNYIVDLVNVKLSQGCTFVKLTKSLAETELLTPSFIQEISEHFRKFGWELSVNINTNLLKLKENI